MIEEIPLTTRSSGCRKVPPSSLSAITRVVQMGQDILLEPRELLSAVNMDIGFLGEQRTFNEKVNNSEPKDIIRFHVKGQANLSLRLTGLSQDANVDVRDEKDALIGAGTSAGKASESINVTLPGQPGVQKTFKVTVYRVGSASTPYTLSLSAMAGWSNTTGFREADTNVRRGLRDVGLAIAPGSSSGASLTDSAWLTDAAGGDGQRMRNAISVYDIWRRSNPRAIVPQMVKEKMQRELPTYNNADAGRLVERIISSYDSRLVGTALPRNDQETLTFLAIRKQCYEWAMTQVRATGGTIKAYGTAGEANMNNWRPGMGLFLYSNSSKKQQDRVHAALIVDIQWDADGKAVALRLAEANWGAGWTNPRGMVPWERTLNNTRVVTISGGANGTVGGYYFSVMNFG